MIRRKQDTITDYICAAGDLCLGLKVMDSEKRDTAGNRNRMRYKETDLECVHLLFTYTYRHITSPFLNSF